MPGNIEILFERMRVYEPAGLNTFDTPYVYAAPAPSTVNSIADFLSRVV